MLQAAMLIFTPRVTLGLRPHLRLHINKSGPSGQAFIAIQMQITPVELDKRSHSYMEYIKEFFAILAE